MVEKDNKDNKDKKDKKKSGVNGQLLFYILIILTLIFVYLMLFGIFSQKHDIFVYPT